jgi:hypothetical protein
MNTLKQRLFVNPGGVAIIISLKGLLNGAANATHLINYFRGHATSAPCQLHNPLAPVSPGPYFWASADANGDCQIIGGDITRLVSWLRGQNVQLQYCPDYEPAWHNPSELPGSAPIGWPNFDVPVTDKVIPGKSRE